MYAKYETPKLIIAEGIICIGVNPFRTSSIIFANTAPIAPYGPNNRPKTNNNPTWGLCIPNSKNCIDENAKETAIIDTNDIAIFISLDFIVSLS